MRIVQAVGWYYPDTLGGTEVYVAALCRWLRAAGHEVLVAAPDPGAVKERRYEHEGAPVYRYPIPAQPTRGECQEQVVVRGAERFHAWLAAEQPDVVHFHTFVTGLGLAEVKAARTAGARVIVTTHSASLGYLCPRGTMMRWGREVCDGVVRPARCSACELQHRGLPRPLAYGIGRIPPSLARVVGRIPGKAGTTLGMSNQIRQRLGSQREMLDQVGRLVLLTGTALEVAAANGAPREKLALNRLGAVHNGLPPKPGPQVRPTVRPVRVGYLGRFDPIKGVHDLARAMRALPAEVPVRVEFRGPLQSFGERQVVAELRAIAGNDPRVTFEPAVAAASINGVLAAWDVLCCPSVTLEGGPTVAIEAHAAGTPVVGTRIGGLAELVTDGVNGRLVTPGDWQSLAGVLREMAEDPAGTIDRWRLALPPARRMEDVASQYLALYQV
jgi:glycosyltransferase involved in cell wall biosynthesis